MKALRSKILVLLGAVGLIGLDQLFKWLAVRYLSGVTTHPLIEGVFHLTYVENRGAAFGILDGKGIFLILLTAAVLIALIGLLFMGKFHHPLLLTAITLFLGGGIGNLIDRIFRHYVVDFLDFRLINFAVFNFADCCVVVGTILLFVYVLFFMDKNKKETDTVLKHESEDMQTHDGQAQS